eukprot:CAMPEP_0172187658 /NCGR_PEP_ID=MMETSP1050-20130122/21466_1 /TAXON_ID=233186 /ORGANISM="Cryptomonas curvata, Strain CCAP979/52" /LENGTH=55 /DNA_ID=CAMNT_0012862017 /DNA_START=172 /DNA_END=339 /DNA_ORIENTATION=+
MTPRTRTHSLTHAARPRVARFMAKSTCAAKVGHAYTGRSETGAKAAAEFRMHSSA